MLQEAKRLADQGISVHWLKPREKAPVEPGWSKAPFQTARDLEAAYRKGYNIGARPGAHSNLGGGYFAYWIDIDIKGTEKRDADEAYAELARLFPMWERLPWVKSGSGGESFHILCTFDGDLPARKLAHSSRKIKWTDKKGKPHDSWTWEIERFGTGKQVAIPPSIHPETGNPYTWGRKFDFNKVEDYYVDLSKIAPSSDGEREDSERSSTRDESSRDLRDTVARMPLGLSRKKIKRVLNGLPDEWAYDYDKWVKVGMALHHEFEGSDEGLEVWHWFSQAEDDKYDPNDLAHRWKGFGQGEFDGKKPVRFATLLKYAEKDAAEEDEEADDALTAAIKRLNKKHALIRNSGKTLVLNEEADGRLTWSRDRDFMTWYADDKIDVWGPPNKDGKSKLVPKSVAQLWLHSPDKRKYEGVTMAPDGKAGLAYNLWRGFSAEPNEWGSCELFLDHVHDNVCAKDKSLFNWVIGWMAHMIQRPAEKPGVALVFKGKRGVGKSIVGEVLGELLAKHTIKVSAAKHLTGQFNAHLSHAVLVRVEEAFWVGDKAGANVLKDMITGLTIRIEQKGVDSGEIPSFHRFLFTSNEQWVIPAGMEERRFAVLEVGEDHIQDRKYFGALLDELKAGGYGALLHFLQNYDLTGFDVGKAPVTQALADQKLASLTGIDAWWAECLSEGILPASRVEQRFDEEAEDGGWEESTVTLPSHEIREHYERWLKARKYQGDPIGAALFSKRLLEMCPTIRVSRPGARVARVKCLTLPALPEARIEFEKQFGQAVFDI